MAQKNVNGHKDIWYFGKQNLKNYIGIWEELTWSFSVLGHFKLNASGNIIQGYKRMYGHRVILCFLEI